MEDETISVFNFARRTDKERGDKPRDIMYWHYNRASYELRRGRYEGGVRVADTGWILGEYNSNEAEQRLRGEYDENVRRIESEMVDRQRLVYVPLTNAIASLRQLLLKLSGNPTETMSRLGVDSGHSATDGVTTRGDA